MSVMLFDKAKFFHRRLPKEYIDGWKVKGLNTSLLIYTYKLFCSHPSILLCRLKRATYRDYFRRQWASRFPCLEHNFVTVGPNHSKLGMHVSVQCQATHFIQWNKISSFTFFFLFEGSYRSVTYGWWERSPGGYRGQIFWISPRKVIQGRFCCPDSFSSCRITILQTSVWVGWKLETYQGGICC